MAVHYLKRGKPEAERAADDAKIRAIVETTLRDIETRGDAAVRELSAKFDKYDPPCFRLSQSDIDAALQKVSARDMDDMFPMVPYHRLPELHGLIKHDLPAPNTSILQAYREVWPALKRQLRYEDWFIKRELPPTAKPYRPEFHGDIVPTPVFAAA
jgi:hypothetical protein